MKQASDGSTYGCATDGVGNLVTISTSTGSTKKPGSNAPDGSLYMTLTTGS